MPKYAKTSSTPRLEREKQLISTAARSDAGFVTSERPRNLFFSASLERIEHLHEDKYKLYDFAPAVDTSRDYGALAGKGSWEGHVDAAKQLKIGLNKNIQDFETGGCNQHYKIPDSVHKIAGMAIPTKLAGRQ